MVPTRPDTSEDTRPLPTSVATASKGIDQMRKRMRCTSFAGVRQRHRYYSREAPASLPPPLGLGTLMPGGRRWSWQSY